MMLVHKFGLVAVAIVSLLSIPSVFAQSTLSTPKQNVQRTETEMSTQQARQRLEFVRELQSKNEQDRLSILKGGV